MSTATYAPGSLEAECPGGLDWAWYGLGECIRSDKDKASIAFGIMSIICWIIFGLPQIIENIKKKIPDSAVSIFLLLFWILVGGFDNSSLDEKTESSEKTTRNGKVLVAVLLGVTGVGILSLGGDQPSMAAASSEYGTRRLLQSAESADPFANFLPWRRKSTEGLSMYLFIMAVLGNTFYSCQIFIKSTDAVYIVTSLPWIIGSLGMLVFDFIILSQFFHYKHKNPKDEENDLDFEESSL
ncbi:hypothetical protein ACTXT7_003498 [Hymenolepis weldensis]